MRTHNGDQREETRVRIRSQRWRDKYAAAGRTDRGAGIPAPTCTFARLRESYLTELFLQTSSDAKHCNVAYNVP